MDIVSTEWQLPTSAVSEPTIENSVEWTNTQNVLTHNTTSFSQLTLPKTMQSHNLIATGYGFSLPAGSTVTGISVQARVIGGGAAIVNIHTLSLVVDGALAGDNLSNNEMLEDKLYEFGGTDVLWGLELPYSTVNSPDFGFAYSVVTGLIGFITAQPRVYYIRMKVHYIEPKHTSNFFMFF